MKNNKEVVLSAFRQRKILTISELTALLGCSPITARRRLKEWCVYTSYNKNGQYYTLPDIPEFDKYQIWRYKDVYFSKYGTLQKTLLALIDDANAGLKVFQASEILGISTHHFLSQQFIHYKKLHREKHQGVYVYYSKNPDIFAKQKKERHKVLSLSHKHELPSDAQAIIILIELIKHPDDTLEQLLRRVKYKGVAVSIIKLRHLLGYHDLLKKILD